VESGPGRPLLTQLSTIHDLPRPVPQQWKVAEQALMLALALVRLSVSARTASHPAVLYSLLPLQRSGYNFQKGVPIDRRRKHGRHSGEGSWNPRLISASMRRICEGGCDCTQAEG
jgi:hypothetical protein